MVATVTSVSTPPILMGELNFKICQHFVGTNLNGGGGGVKLYEGVIFITTPSLFHFISLERSNTQKSEVFLLRIFSGNLNISEVVTC